MLTAVITMLGLAAVSGLISTAAAAYWPTHSERDRLIERIDMCEARRR